QAVPQPDPETELAVVAVVDLDTDPRRFPHLGTGSAGRDRAKRGRADEDLRKCFHGVKLNQALGILSMRSATIARNSLLGLKTGTGRAATSTGSPVRGLRAMRVLRLRILNVPKPRISMFFWSARASLTASRKLSTTRAQSFLLIIGPAVRAICAVTFSTRSALVINASSARPVSCPEGDGLPIWKLAC